MRTPKYGVIGTTLPGVLRGLEADSRGVSKTTAPYVLSFSIVGYHIGELSNLSSNELVAVAGLSARIPPLTIM